MRSVSRSWTPPCQYRLAGQARSVGRRQLRPARIAQCARTAAVEFAQSRRRWFEERSFTILRGVSHVIPALGANMVVHPTTQEGGRTDGVQIAIAAVAIGARWPPWAAKRD